MQCVVRVKKGEEKAKDGGDPVPARRKKGARKKQPQQGKEQQRRKPKSSSAAAAVDEDLYKISPNVMCKVQKASYYYSLYPAIVIVQFNLLRDQWVYFCLLCWA
jgi:hypothetical protein